MALEDLAEILKKGFDELDTRAEARAAALEEHLAGAKAESTHEMAHVVEWLEELEARVTALENGTKEADRG